MSRNRPAGPEGVCLSVVVPTTAGAPGRVTTLLECLGELAGQARSHDEVILVGDGQCPGASILWHSQEPPLPGLYVEIRGPSYDWGHTPRNRAMPLCRGDYVLSLDDDDRYLPGALDAIRAAAWAAWGKLLLFRMNWPERGLVLWQDRDVRRGNVSTQMIACPNFHPGGAPGGAPGCSPGMPGVPGVWGSRYEGDLDFVQSCVRAGLAVEWVDHILLDYRQGSRGG